MQRDDRGDAARGTAGEPDVSLDVIPLHSTNLLTVLDAGFYVADDGVGIPDDARDVVFDAGYSSASDRMGLGLRIVEQVAQAHDWTVHVTESDAGGARFEFTAVETPWRTLPAVSPDAGLRVPRRPPDSGARSCPRRTRRSRCPPGAGA
jgi:hypothetical protein